MKKLKLLLMAATLFGGVCSVNAQETPTNGSAYYIYNADNDLFFTRGADWGTQAFASPVGIPWRVEINDGKYTLKMLDIYTQNTNDIGLGFNGSYVDNGSPIALTPSGNASDGFTLENGGNYITCPATKGVVTMTSTASKWKFLTQAQYDAIMASRASAQETDVATSKGITIPGGKTLNEVVTDVNAWTSTTTADALPTKATWTKTGGTQRNNNYNEGDYGVELFESNAASISKTISGLASGIYKVSVRGMRRDGTNSACAAMKTAGFYPRDVYMEANGNIIPVKAWADDNTADDNPDSPAQTVAIINNGGYTSEGFVYVGNDGNLNLTIYTDAFWWGCWFVFNGVSYTYYNNEVSNEDATAILTTATTLEAKEMDADLLSALSSAKTTFNGAHTIANYNALQTAVDAAQTSADAYALFAPERTKALALGMTAEAIATYAPDVQALMVAEYNYVNTNYSYGVSLGTWTKTNATERRGEHWDGTTDTQTGTPYSEQSEGWNNGNWSCSYSQNLTLPAGKYVFKVAGRKSSNDAVLTLTVKNGETVIGTVNDFPNGNTGKGIDTSGATNFGDGTFANDGTGRGWQWRYVQFTLTDPATVTVEITGSATPKQQWVGFCNPTVQTDDEANVLLIASLIAYNSALNEAITARDAQANKYVGGTDRSNLVTAINADENLDKTNKDAIDEATATLNSTKETFLAGVSKWNAYTIAKNTTYADDKPYASAEKYAAIATAKSGGVSTASEAEVKTNAIYSAYRLYVESNALAEGVTGAEDKTNLISDPNLDVTISEMTAGAWTFTQGGGSAQILDNEPLTDGTSSSSYKYYDYNNGDNNNQNLYQTITNLPAGRYLLTTSARAATVFNNYFYLSVKDGEAAAQTANIPAVGNSGGTFGRGWNDASIEFIHPTDGDVEIKVYSDGGSGSNKRAGWWGATRFRLVRIGDPTETVSISDAGLATYVSDYDLDFSNVSGLKAYKAKVDGTKVKFTEVTTVPAGEGVLLEGVEGQYDVTVTTGVEAWADEDNDFIRGTGDAVETGTGDVKNYILSTDEDGNSVGFYYANGETVATNKAYIQAAVSAGSSRLMMVFGGEATGIKTFNRVAENGALYNLNGSRVAKPTKGLYIQDGKKVVIK